MGVLRIAVNPDSHSQRLGCTLDGERWVLRLRQSLRAGRYMLDVFDATGEAALLSVPVSLAQPLFGQFRAGRPLPAGDLVALDLTGANREPGPDNPLGRAVQLYYLEAPV